MKLTGNFTIREKDYNHTSKKPQLGKTFFFEQNSMLEPVTDKNFIIKYDCSIKVDKAQLVWLMGLMCGGNHWTLNHDNKNGITYNYHLDNSRNKIDVDALNKRGLPEQIQINNVTYTALAIGIAICIKNKDERNISVCYKNMNIDPDFKQTTHQIWVNIHIAELTDDQHHCDSNVILKKLFQGAANVLTTRNDKFVELYDLLPYPLNPKYIVTVGEDEYKRYKFARTAAPATTAANNEESIDDDHPSSFPSSP